MQRYAERLSLKFGWSKFQSSPGQDAGCNGCRPVVRSNHSTFQSSPGQDAGCNLDALTATTMLPAFQSSPGQDAGCNICTVCVVAAKPEFQSSPGQDAGCNVDEGLRIRRIRQVSILTRPRRRMQRFLNRFG